MKKLKWHLKQIYLTIKTRKSRGSMDIVVYHCFRIYKLWEYRCSDVNRDLTIHQF